MPKRGRLANVAISAKATSCERRKVGKVPTGRQMRPVTRRRWRWSPEKSVPLVAVTRLPDTLLDCPLWSWLGKRRALARLVGGVMMTPVVLYFAKAVIR